MIMLYKMLSCQHICFRDFPSCFDRVSDMLGKPMWQGTLGIFLAWRVVSSQSPARGQVPQFYNQSQGNKFLPVM